MGDEALRERERASTGLYRWRWKRKWMMRDSFRPSSKFDKDTDFHNVRFWSFSSVTAFFFGHCRRWSCQHRFPANGLMTSKWPSWKGGCGLDSYGLLGKSSLNMVLLLIWACQCHFLPWLSVIRAVFRFPNDVRKEWLWVSLRILGENEYE